MDEGIKFFMKILVIVTIVGVAFVGVTKANKAQKEKSELIQNTSDTIWQEVQN